MKNILIRSTKASTMMTNLVSKDFLQEYFLVPEIDEQKKIGRFLFLLDEYFSICQIKLDKIQRIKDTLLSRLFV